MKKQLLFLVGAWIFFIGCVASEKKENKPTQSTLMINLISDATVNPHSSLMGIHLAEKAHNNGIKATIFLNVSGVKLLQPGADTIVFNNQSIVQALNKVAEKGVEVVACPHCMEALGIKKESLPAYVKIGEEKVMIEKIRNQPTVFTY